MQVKFLKWRRNNANASAQKQRVCFERRGSLSKSSTRYQTELNNFINCRAGQRRFGQLILISRTQVKYIHRAECITLPGLIIPPSKYTKRNLTFVVRRQLRHTPVKSFDVGQEGHQRMSLYSLSVGQEGHYFIVFDLQPGHVKEFNWSVT